MSGRREAILPQSRHVLKIVSTTWNRVAEDLFDFEAEDVTTQSFSLAQADRWPTTWITRVGNVVSLAPASELASGPDSRGVSDTGETLACCQWQDDGSVHLDRPAAVTGTRRQWLVIRGREGGHSLSEEEVIKLGFFKFRVRQLVASADDGAQPDLRMNSPELDRSDIDMDEVQDGDQLSCRICLMEGSTREDPLVRPCQCRGTIEYVHVGCLRLWIEDRLDTRGREHGSYHWRPLPCELCKTIYPAYCRSVRDGTREPLVQVPQTEPPYIVLENMTKDTHVHSARGLRIISLAGGRTVKLGRGSDNDVSISDVSTSRLHATLRFKGGKFVIEDEKSKFGTFVTMRRLPPLGPGSGMSIQVGRTILRLTVQVPDVAARGLAEQDDVKSVSTCEDTAGDDEEIISI
ncbi:unnamed protein product [Prorocentrum cordatum]|uniref:RING-CH-type domain-containing protein n=1 Tax=Prorocentrum cordatum TaxID=2364126 RepID=A0ABN9SQJ7_9DINO|nr:unnamed protein product [Polarella glacialis]